MSSSLNKFPVGSSQGSGQERPSDSPSLDEELFAELRSEAWQSHLDGSQAESPFQHAFEQEDVSFLDSELDKSVETLEELEQESQIRPANVNVNHFICSEADRDQIERVLERPISLDDLRSAVEEAIGNVVSWSTKTANGLSRSRRRHSISKSGSTEQLFHEAFGTSPGFVPKWRPSGQKWDRGDIVRIRLKRAVKVLSGGSLKFFCWGPNQRPDMPWKPTSNSGLNAKKYEIYFGQGFWKAWKNGDSASMGSTLLMSALAIYYDTVSYFGSRSRYGNSHCYAHFVLRANDFTDLPDRVIKRCEPVVPPDVEQILKKINDAVLLLKKSENFLTTQAQQELLKEIISEMSWFFQDGHYGIRSKQGKDIRASRKYRIELLVPRPSRSNQPFFFHHDTRLYLSHEVNQRIGDHKTMGAHRSRIRLYIPNLITRSPDSIAGHLIHEMLHMMRSRFRGIESKYDRSTARSIPTKAAGALLDLHALNPHRQKMLQHFTTLIDFLKLDRSLAATFADHVLEEILAYVFTTRIRDAIAGHEAEQSGIGISLSFDPVQFLQIYLKRYWLPHPELREALKTTDGQKIIRDMDNELKQLKVAIEKHIDNPASSAPQSDKEFNFESDTISEEAEYYFEEDIDEAEQEQFTDLEFDAEEIDNETFPTEFQDEELEELEFDALSEEFEEAFDGEGAEEELQDETVLFDELEADIDDELIFEAEDESEEAEALLAESETGSYKEKITWVQTILKIAAGEKTLAVDGKWGSQTKAAVLRFQKQYKLRTKNGKVTPETNVALNQNALEWLYRKSIANPYGQMNTTMREEIKQFQRDYKLSPDGKVGPASREAMVKALNRQLPSPLRSYHFILGKGKFVAEAPIEMGYVEDREVIGLTDARKDIAKISSTEKIPFRFICSLKVTFDNPYGSGEVEFDSGTGFLIGDRYVLTSAHQLYAEIHGPDGQVKVQEAKKVIVYPGRNGSNKPFGSAVSTSLRYHDKFKNNNFDARYDYGLIKLGTAIGAKKFKRLGNKPLGWWGSPHYGGGTRIKPLSRNWLQKRILNVSGYPIHKNHTQWLAYDHVKDAKPAANKTHLPELITYLVDTSVGQSGSPAWVYMKKSKRRYLTAVHRGGCHANLDGCLNTKGKVTSNMGVLITKDVLDQINDWKKNM